jgi:AraC-like DNA-binding protein/ligand-binding sensor protein
MSTNTIDRTDKAARRVFDLAVSQIFKDYQQAFTTATGLPLKLVGVGNSGSKPLVTSKESPFCALLARTNTSCNACLAMQRQLEEEAKVQPKTLKCFAGLCETAIPVRVGQELIAFLETGHVLLTQPSKTKFKRMARELIKWGSEVDLKRAEEAYFNSRVLSEAQYQSMVRLATIFAEHLASCGAQLALRCSQVEPGSVTKARQWIDQNSAEEFSLREVAKVVNVSAKYFSELFKQVTGVAFAEYVGRIRVEKAKDLLVAGNQRISEIAFEVGFQSLSQFNRSFVKFTGRSPKTFRDGISPTLG